MLYNFSFFILLFFIYSFIGYILEVIVVSKIEQRLVLSRGYLIGPYLPIFGFGSLLVIAILYKYSNDLLVLFILGTVLCCLLEYLTSYILEKLFKLRWWDYSDKKYNINGRICLENGIFFGILTVLLVKYINPFFINYLLLINNNIIIIIGILLFSIILFDFIFSSFVIINLHEKASIYSKKDSTEQVKDEIIKKLRKYKLFNSRLLKAFPNFNNNKKMYDINNILEKYNKLKRR